MATKGMENNLECRRQKVAWKESFIAKRELTKLLKLWWHPPEVACSHIRKPEMYHRKSLFLWILKCLWYIDFKLPTCSTPQSLRYYYNTSMLYRMTKFT